MGLPSVGDTVSHYLVQSKLGEGGMGVVFRARDLRLEREVAIKFMALSPGKLDGADKERFYREARTASLLDHPGIATVYEIDEVDGAVFIVMGLIDGTTLQDRIQRTRLKVEEVLDLGLQVAEGLQAAHEKGLVHRDIKSANIMVNARGQARIVDFGLAKLKAAGRISRTGTTSGTLLYMAPEQVRGKPVDHRSDLWSLGVVLYEMFTGELPFKGDNEGSVLQAILNEQAPSPSALDRRVPLAVDSLVARLLEKDPDRRPQAAEEVVRGIREIRSAAETAARAGKQKAIAVLPFQNISPDKETDYFGDGLTEELIANLSRLKDVRVVSRTTSMQYRGTQKDVKSIGRELGVRYIVEGSVRKFHDNLRITTQLVDVESDAQLWAETYKGKLDDVFEIQEQVSKQIVDALMVKLAPAEMVGLGRRATDSTEAFDCCLKARGFLERSTRRELQFAIDLFRKAIELDPRYAAAHAGLGRAFTSMYRLFERREQWLDRAIECGLKALMYDANLAAAYSTLGMAYLSKRQTEEALQAALKSVELDPQDYNGHWVLGRVYLASDRPHEAAERFQEVLKINPEFFGAYSFLRTSQTLIGQADQAAGTLRRELEFYRTYVPGHPDETLAIVFYAQTLAAVGSRHEAVEMAEKARALSPGDSLMLYNLACLNSTLGEMQRALGLLSEAVETGYENAEWISRDPDLAPIRDTPEYRALMERLSARHRVRP